MKKTQFHVLQDRLALFTDQVCETIDDMMQGRETPRMIFDEDTLLNKISHQLNRLYQMLQAGKKNMEEQRADLQEMISDISHQVKTPVTNLKMAAATLLERDFSRRQQIEYLQSMNVQLDKLDFLMRTMVKASRLETGIIIQKKERKCGQIYAVRRNYPGNGRPAFGLHENRGRRYGPRHPGKSSGGHI